MLVDKLTPRFDSYKRGDIVVFLPPNAPPDSIPYIKRVIGVGGDVVDIRDGHIYINDQELDEPYVFPGQTTEATGGQDHYVIPDGELFVVGDHRQNSSDSRVFGPISGLDRHRPCVASLLADQHADGPGDAHLSRSPAASAALRRAGRSDQRRRVRRRAPEPRGLILRASRGTGRDRFAGRRIRRGHGCSAGRRNCRHTGASFSASALPCSPRRSPSSRPWDLSPAHSGSSRPSWRRSCCSEDRARTMPAAAPVPLGGWPEAAFVVLGAAMTFAAGQANGSPGDAAALAAASACGLAAVVLLLFATGVRRTAAGPSWRWSRSRSRRTGLA